MERRQHDVADINDGVKKLVYLEQQLEAHQLYVRELCRAVDAATDFAGTVAGGASWWDDVWSGHESALDQARAAISKEQE